MHLATSTTGDPPNFFSRFLADLAPLRQHPPAGRKKILPFLDTLVQPELSRKDRHPMTLTS
jgi:hypothetical protein